MPEKKYAQVGEQVRIITPRLFERAGYPLTIKKVMDQFQDEIHLMINAAYFDFMKVNNNTQNIIWNGNMSSRVYSSLNMAAAAYIIERENFGGKNRSVYEYEENKSLLNQIVTVKSRQFVKTGTYVPMSGGYSYDGDYDYDPAYLEDEKTHCVYTIHNEKLDLLVSSGQFHLKNECKILARNCQLLTAKERAIDCKTVVHNHLGEIFVAYHIKTENSVEMYECIKCGRIINVKAAGA